jgi:thiosulfate dehydrogenase [quinone] large subunit
MSEGKIVQIPEPPIARFLFGSTVFSWLWLIIRVYVGWQWLTAGWAKLSNPAWTGSQAGSAVHGFLAGALQKMTGPHPDVSAWYGTLINNIALPHAALISCLVVYGEIAVGIALILGIFTGIAAFFGTFMNLNYLFAGTVSINPFLLFLQLFLILAWRTAGWVGVDRYLLPLLGTPWQPGRAFTKK